MPPSDKFPLHQTKCQCARPIVIASKARQSRCRRDHPFAQIVIASKGRQSRCWKGHPFRQNVIASEARQSRCCRAHAQRNDNATPLRSYDCSARMRRLFRESTFSTAAVLSNRGDNITQPLRKIDDPFPPNQSSSISTLAATPATSDAPRRWCQRTQHPVAGRLVSHLSRC